MSNARSLSGARRERIVEFAREAAFLRPTELARDLGVSAETIRRDLLVLERAGQVRRVHGGALGVDVLDTIPARGARRVTQLAEKRQIGSIAAGLLRDGDVVLMEIGTTVEIAARALPRSWSGTVITNSLAVGAILNDRSGVELHVLGGQVRLGEMNTYGPDTLQQLSGINANVAFLAVGGVDVDAGITDYYLEDVAVKQMMMSRAARSYALASSQKLGRHTTRSVCNVDAVTAIVTDSYADQGVLAALRAHGAAVLQS